MTVQSHGLGGRVALLDPKELTGARKETYDLMNSKAVPWAKKSGFKAQTSDGKMIGPFNGFMFSPEITEWFLNWEDVEQEHTTLTNRERQVVILSVVAVWKCDYERYAHAALARTIGMPDAAVEALCNGNPATDLSDKEQLAQRFTTKLTAEHEIDDNLYTEIETAFGSQGIVDIIQLAGHYITISSLLNTFKVPVPN